MVIKGINFKSLVIAGLLAGYIMFFVDEWFAGTLGLFGIFPGTGNPWWMLTHHIDSIVLAVAFAWPPVYSHLPGRSWLKGLTFGLLWFIAVLITTIVAGALGSKMFGAMQYTAAIIISMLLLHLVYGFFLGAFYNGSSTQQTAAGQVA